MKILKIFLTGMLLSILSQKESISQHILVHEISQSDPLFVDAGPDQRGALSAIHLGLPDPVDGGSPPYKYSWTPAEKVKNANSPKTNPTEYSETGYILTVTDQNNCTASDTVFFDLITGLLEMQDEVNIYPNPAGNYLFINQTENAIRNIQLFNLHGKQVTVPVDYQNGISIELSTLTKGTYVLRFDLEDNTIQRKIVIQ